MSYFAVSLYTMLRLPNSYYNLNEHPHTTVLINNNITKTTNSYMFWTLLAHNNIVQQANKTTA